MTQHRPTITHLTYINQTFGMGGAETVNRDLLLALQDHGVRIQAYTTYSPFAEMLAESGLPTHRLPIEIDIIGDWKGIIKAFVLWPLAVVQYMRVILHARHSDTVLMSGFFEKIIVTPIAKLVGVPVVWVEYAPMTAVFQKFRGVPGWMYRQVLRWVDRIIVPTEHTKKYFEKSLPVTRGKLVVLPCGRYRLDVKQYAVSAPSRPTVVCVSRMEPGKGQDLLVQAFAQVKEFVPDAQLRLIGAGGFREVVEREVHRLHLEDSVELLGWVDDPLQEVAQANICVFPSVWALEGFGMVTIEAMAFGKPVVAFDCGPTPYILQHGETGLLVPAGDVTRLADALVSILKDTSLAQQLGKNAQQEFYDKFRLEKIIDQYIEVFTLAKVSIYEKTS